MSETITKEFSSVNEDGIIKVDKMLELPIGGKCVTRRKIEPTDKCMNCKKEFKEHYPKENLICCKSMEKIETDLFVTANAYTSVFSPAKYAIGTKVQITKRPLAEGEQKGDNVLCGCSHEYREHHLPLNKLGQKVSGLGKACFNFEPIILKITGGMWHKEWQKNICNSCEIKIKRGVEGYDTAKNNALMGEEAELEGFNTVKGWLNAAEENKDKWGKLEDVWRITLERIQ